MSDTIPKFKKWNESVTIDYHLCRICMSLSDLLIPIFEGEGIEQELYDKIQKHLPIKITNSDTLPLQICYLCAGTLIAWNSLYIACVKTDKKLKSLLNAKKLNEFINNEISSDDELSTPPKKRKLISAKEKKEGVTEGLLSKLEKSRTKVFIPKKIKKLNKFKEKMPNNKNKDLDKNKAEKGPGNTSNKATESSENNFSEENILFTEIKTECDSEEEETANTEEIRNGNEILESTLIKCEFCNKSYKDKKCLGRHIKKFHDESKTLEAQKCELCGNIYKTRSNLEKHYTKEHFTNQVSCPVCHISFNSKKLDVHLKSIHGVKTENENEEKCKCKVCDKWFKNKYVRNSHVKEVHLSEPVKCKLCDFEGVKSVLRRHKRDVHAEKKFLCSLCPGAFKTLHTLKMHMTSHSDIRCYTCDICGMGFKRLNNVRDHMKCHEQKSNQCQICGNFFARKRYLAIHEKTIHNFYSDGIIPEEKGFECGTCGAKLKWKKNLLAHMRIHTGEKPYVCKICNKDFICHGSLRTHMAKHSVCVLNEGDQNLLSVEVNVFNSFNPEQS